MKKYFSLAEAVRDSLSSTKAQLTESAEDIINDSKLKTLCNFAQKYNVEHIYSSVLSYLDSEIKLRYCDGFEFETNAYKWFEKYVGNKKRNTLFKSIGKRETYESYNKDAKKSLDYYFGIINSDVINCILPEFNVMDAVFDVYENNFRIRVTLKTPLNMDDKTLNNICSSKSKLFIDGNYYNDWKLVILRFKNVFGKR